MKKYNQKKTENGFTQLPASFSKMKVAGFTFVETLVAITVLLLGIIGPLTIAQKGIQSAYNANEQVTAVFLAQEAIEAVRELRDTNALDAYDKLVDAAPTFGETWDWYGEDSIFHDDCKLSVGCGFKDSGNDKFKKCNGGMNNCILKIDAGVYSHTGGGSNSPFTRKVYVGPVTGGGISVTVKVSWTPQIFGGGTPQHVILQTWIYDHYQRYEEN